MHDYSNEQWRAVPGWEGYYEVSDHGRVRSLWRTVMRSNGRKQSVKGRLLSLVNNSVHGYPQVTLSGGGVTAKKNVHELVTSAFIGPRPARMEVCHDNGNPEDNRVENLRYGTRSENSHDRVRHGRHYQAEKISCPRGHLLQEPNLRNRKNNEGYRGCLACHRAGSYLHYHSLPKEDLGRVANSYYAKIMGIQPAR